MFLLHNKLITQGEKRETSTKTCNETMLRDKLRVFVSRISSPLNCFVSLTCSFLQEGQTNYTFFTTNEARKITDSISCHSKNLIYLIECKKKIGETKRQLNERFGEHRRSILNHQQLSITTPVLLHFNQAAAIPLTTSTLSPSNSYAANGTR